MPSNYSYLEQKPEYSLFSRAAMEAEMALSLSPTVAAASARRALELAVKWVYSADNTIIEPDRRSNLQALIHEPSFKLSVVEDTWRKLRYIIELGNNAMHTNIHIKRGDAIYSLSSLFEFIQWIDYCYGSDYEERTFDKSLIPELMMVSEVRPVYENDIRVQQNNPEIESERAAIAADSRVYTSRREEQREHRNFTPEEISEFETRKRYIDLDLLSMGWVLGDADDMSANARIEVELRGMPYESGIGYADYVLYGKNGLPLAVVEAKKTSVDPEVGKVQGKLYADCLENMTGQRPIIFYTNGFETHIWDDTASPPRQVSFVFSEGDLEKIVTRREQRKNLCEIPISDLITNRYYQKEAIRAICGNIEEGIRKHLLVMATGTGKTRTACSLVDVLSRGEQVTNVLFLADRVALVGQAKDEFRTYLPDMSLCNLLSNRDDKNARIVFSTYPTILNAIDTAKSNEGKRLFTPAHFDLIIIDEAHRSIFKKFRAIFDYFDANLVGLTATPRGDVDRNTYDFFERPPREPTHVYDYETARDRDKVLVPYHCIEVKMKFLDEGIRYDQLSEEDKERFEEDFTDVDGDMPDYVPPPKINDHIFNQKTVDDVLQMLMEKGLRIPGKDHPGKTIIFAANHKHAMYIEERFNKLYPQYRGHFAQVIDNKIKHSGELIKTFKVPNKDPVIAISVDMLDTGIDVPEILNLVFFKKVMSKIKFWQMLGRGTRTCKDLFGEGKDKPCFYIFDYLANFEFFGENPNGIEGVETESTTEAIFKKKIRLIYHLQDSRFTDEKYQTFRKGLVDAVITQIKLLNEELTTVRLQRQYIEKYKHIESFLSLNDNDTAVLSRNIAPLVFTDEQDECASQFDNFIYGLMLMKLENSKLFGKGKKRLSSTSVKLSGKASIPQVNDKIGLIRAIPTDEFWIDIDITTLENVRVQLRDLIKFIVEDGERATIYTNLNDEVLEINEGREISSSDDFDDYRTKVNRYIEDNKDNIVIHKLRNNLPLSDTDFIALENILTGELGTPDDYMREFGDTPFGLLVRKVAKLEIEAANEVFSEFINDQNLEQKQIVFIQKVIDYIVQNGYVESPSDLLKPPFDKPTVFMRLFDIDKQRRIIEILEDVKSNAIAANM